MSSKHFYNEESSCTSIDSDSDFKEIFSSSSYDRSSIGSIPWAEDAVKQNQQEWERIERMFYGEEDLPLQEVELTNEILEWWQAFPHLRVNGKKLNEIEQNNNNNNNNNKSILPSKDFGKIFKVKTVRYLEHGDLSKEENREKILISELEKNLRISSVPVLHRKHFLMRSNTNNSKDLNHLPNFNPKESNRNKKLSQISKSIGLSNFQDSRNGATAKSSSSASFIRMPPIMKTIYPSINHFTHPLNRQNNNSLRKLKSEKSTTVLLPEIKPYKTSYDNNCRSVSAATTHPTLSSCLSCSASKLKNK